MTLTLATLAARLRAASGLVVSADRPPGPTVTTAAEFYAAMKAAKGGDAVYLAPGAWPLLTLSSFVRDAPVAILAADPAKRPVLEGVKLSNCRNLVVRGLEVFAPAGPCVEVLGGSDIHVEGNELHGPLAADGSHVRTGKGARFRGVVRWSLRLNDIHDVNKGVDHFLGAVDSSFGAIEANSFRDLSGDGITGCSDNITVRWNFLADLYRVDANHPDAIQFGTPAAWRKGPPVNVTITDNVWVKGAGDPVQGVFVKSEQFALLKYEGLVVARNAMVGGMYHGIAVSAAVDPLIGGNFVQGMEGVVDTGGRAMHAWLRLSDSAGGRILDNITSRSLSLSTNTPAPSVLENRTVPIAPAGDYSALLAWADKTYPAPVAEIPDDPREAELAALEAEVQRLAGSLADEIEARIAAEGQVTELRAKLGVANETIETGAQALAAERAVVAAQKEVLRAISATALSAADA